MLWNMSAVTGSLAMRTAMANVLPWSEWTTPLAKVLVIPLAILVYASHLRLAKDHSTVRLALTFFVALVYVWAIDLLTVIPMPHITLVDGLEHLAWSMVRVLVFALGGAILAESFVRRLSEGCNHET
jgi:hypothetical protein